MINLQHTYKEQELREQGMPVDEYPLSLITNGSVHGALLYAVCNSGPKRYIDLEQFLKASRVPERDRHFFTVDKAAYIRQQQVNGDERPFMPTDRLLTAYIDYMRVLASRRRSLANKGQAKKVGSETRFVMDNAGIAPVLKRYQTRRHAARIDWARRNVYIGALQLGLYERLERLVDKVKEGKARPTYVGRSPRGKDRDEKTRWLMRQWTEVKRQYKDIQELHSIYDRSRSDSTRQDVRTELEEGYKSLATLVLDSFKLPVLDSYTKALTRKNSLEDLIGPDMKESMQELRTRINDLIEHNMRLVVTIGSRYQSRGLPFPDILQFGNKGLIKGVERNDYKKGWSIGTYVSWWIKQNINRGLTDLSHAIRVPSHIHVIARDVHRIVQRYLVKEDRWPYPEEVQQELGKSLSSIELAIDLIYGKFDPMSLEQPVPESGVEMLDLMEGVEPDQEDRLVREDNRREVEMAVSALERKEEKVLRIRYGINDGIPKTLTDTGKAMGFSRERVRQIEKKALAKIRKRRALEKKYSGLDS